MASNINPSLEPTKSLSNFRFWCQKVLPLVYDDSLSYYEVLGKMVVQLNDVIDDVNADIENVDTLKEAFLALQTYVNEFFDDIDQLASYAERAEAAQAAANTSAINAASSASNASASSLAAMGARDTAVAAGEAAQASANNASTAATNATTKANEAAQSAITAQTAQASASQSATLAATDRSAAQTAASTATTKANEASTSAENAAQSEANTEELVNNIRENLDNIQQNTQDISDLKESIGDKAPIIVSNASGVIAHFTDGADSMPVKTLTIEGVESANVTRTGKNLSQPSYRLSDTNYIIPPIWLPSGVYTISFGGRASVTAIYVRKGNSVTVVGDAFASKFNSNFFTFTADENGYYYAQLYRSPTSDSWDAAPITNNQLEIGSSVTPYNAYRSDTFIYPSETVTTLYGVNNIWSEDGNIDVTYCADTKLYFDNKIAELQATMLENIGG